ncbi:MAG TPA: T9SS type A sorting domain-containing protein [Rhodothermales bacterium]|nr:T9SS type A sorting domain-containing protein [Rhodothermales bacterium]
MRFVPVLLVLLWTLPATAQEFSVIDADPAPGDSSVALQTTVRFIFSAPVDTSFRFTDVSTLPVEFYAISPADSIQIDSTYFNEGLTELSFEVTHTDDTDFVWVMTGALDEDGVLLCEPYVLSYTTADRPGAFSVSGELYVAIPVKGGPSLCTSFDRYVAMLLDTPDVGTATIKAASVVEQDVDFRFPYTISDVRNGIYWPVTRSDTDSDGVIDGFGGYEYYDEDFDGKRDSLVVADSNRTNIVMLVSGPGATQDPTELPGVASLLPNYPNPFNPQTTLAFRLERPMPVRLTVFDVLGRQVAAVADGFYPAGSHTATWMAEHVPSGLYVVRLQGDRFQLARPVVLVK